MRFLPGLFRRNIPCDPDSDLTHLENDISFEIVELIQKETTKRHLMSTLASSWKVTLITAALIILALSGASLEKASLLSWLID